LPSNGVLALLTDHLGRVWAGTDAGLALRAEAGYWITFTTANSPIASNAVRALAQDNADRLWIGTPGGVSILSLSGPGAMGWSSLGAPGNLPSNAVNTLAADAVGAMWVGTDAGLVQWSPFSPPGTVYSTTNGPLPGNRITHLTVDGLNRVWVATDAGVAMREGSQWKAFHVPGTLIESARITGLAGDSLRTWVAATGNPTTTSSIAARGVLTKPIGNVAPSIASFAPISATPGDKVIITGNGFDDRGPEFNIARFPGPWNAPYAYAEVVTVTSTSMAVKVPALSSSGKLQVSANGFNSPFSSANFQLKPFISTLNNYCLALGSELQINGTGFADGSGAAYVKIGSGAERIADATDPTQLRVFIRPGDTQGKVQVRLTNGNTSLSANSVQITSLALGGAFAQQGIQDETMIWGKRTLVQLQLASAGCGTSTLTRARADWIFTNGASIPGDSVVYTLGKTIPTSVQPVNLVNSVSLMPELNLSDVLYKLNKPASESTLKYFSGISVTLSNNLVNVMTVFIPADQLFFIDTSLARRHLLTMRITGDRPSRQDPNYYQTMLDNMDAAARLFPQQDAWWYGGPYNWLQDIYVWTTLDYRVKISDNDGEARDIADEYIDPGSNTWGVAFIDRMNVTTDTAGGVSSSWWDTFAAVNDVNLGGRYLVHEWMHAFGYVDGDAPNYYNDPAPGGDNHSKYDEGKWDTDGPDNTDFNNCVSSRTFRQALTDFSSPTMRVVRLADSGPADMITAACSSAALAAQRRTAKSVISYASKRNNFNTFIEPVDYRNLLSDLCIRSDFPAATSHSICAGYANYKPPAALLARSPLAAADVTRTLRLSGKINGASGVVTPSVSYVAVNDGAVTPQDYEGNYHLIVRAADNRVLHDQLFRLDESAHAPHDAAARVAAHEDVSAAVVSLFNLRVPFPANATQAEISHDDNALWSQTVSANAPSVTFVSPNGGTFDASQPMTVTWTANDLDAGDVLQFGLDYSADGGATWNLVAPKISDNSFSFVPNFLPGSNAALLRLRASDGFNTGSATSTPFVLKPRGPEAIILSPEDGQSFTEGAWVTLKGTSMVAGGIGGGVFTWTQGTQMLGLTHTLDVELKGVGVQTFTLQVASNGMTATRSVTLTVAPDYDRDGLPNAWETQYAFNPLDPSDPAGDADTDGLTNADEYTQGTHPRIADTDGDLYSDSAELAAGTDPLNAASMPAQAPELSVGSTSMGFTFHYYSPLPAPEWTMVTNAGGGTLNFTTTVDAPWLVAGPAAGTAPQKLTVGYNTAGLAPGTYQGHVVVTAPGVAGSPHTITVTLNVESLPRFAYLPLVSR
jgi:hypothetical protein